MGNQSNIIELRGARLANAKLVGVNLYGAVLDDAVLSGAVLEDCFAARLRARSARFENARFDHICLYEADLADSDLTGAIVRHAELSRALLGGAQCAGANFYGSCLRGADLTSTNLDSASLLEADVRDVNFADAYMRACDVEGARGILHGMAGPLDMYLVEWTDGPRVHTPRHWLTVRQARARFADEGNPHNDAFRSTFEALLAKARSYGWPGTDES